MACGQACNALLTAAVLALSVLSPIAGQLQQPNETALAECIHNVATRVNCSANSTSSRYAAGDVATGFFPNCAIPYLQPEAATSRPTVKLLHPNIVITNTTVIPLAASLSRSMQYPLGVDVVDSRLWTQAPLREFDNNTNGLRHAWFLDPVLTADMADEPVGALADLSQLVLQDTNLDWAGFGTFFRRFASVYDGKVVGLPVSAAIMLFYYRRDFFTARNLTVPATWEEVVDLAERFNGTDLEGNGRGAWGFCMSRQPECYNGYTFQAMQVPFLQALGSSQGFHFDPESMTPLVNSTGSRRAAQLYRRLARFTAPTEPVACLPVSLSFVSGNCLMAVGTTLHFKYTTFNNSLNNMTRVRGKTGTAVLPGSLEVEDRATGQLVGCNPITCPYGRNHTLENGTVVWVNSAPYAGRGAFTYALNRRMRPELQYMAYRLTARRVYSDSMWPSVLNPTAETTPVRSEMVTPASLYRYTAAGYSGNDTLLFMKAVSETVEHPNIALNLRIDGAIKYYLAVDRAAVALMGTSEDPDTILARAQAEVVDLYRNRTTDWLRQRYWKSIERKVLPPPPPLQPSRSNAPLRVSVGTGVGVGGGLVVIGLLLALAWRTVVVARRRGRRGPYVPVPGPEVTLVVTDIEGSTNLWETQPADIMGAALQLHDAIARRLLAGNEGYVSATEGDSFIAVFPHPMAAARFCLAFQSELAAAEWPPALLRDAELCRPVFAVPRSHKEAVLQVASRAASHTPLARGLSACASTFKLLARNSPTNSSFASQASGLPSTTIHPLPPTALPSPLPPPTQETTALQATRTSRSFSQLSRHSPRNPSAIAAAAAAGSATAATTALPPATSETLIRRQTASHLRPSSGPHGCRASPLSGRSLFPGPVPAAHTSPSPLSDLTNATNATALYPTDGAGRGSSVSGPLPPLPVPTPTTSTSTTAPQLDMPIQEVLAPLPAPAMVQEGEEEEEEGALAEAGAGVPRGEPVLGALGLERAASGAAAGAGTPIEGNAICRRLLGMAPLALSNTAGGEGAGGGGRQGEQEGGNNGLGSTNTGRLSAVQPSTATGLSESAGGGGGGGGGGVSITPGKWAMAPGGGGGGGGSGLASSLGHNPSLPSLDMAGGSKPAGAGALGSGGGGLGGGGVGRLAGFVADTVASSWPWGWEAAEMWQTLDSSDTGAVTVFRGLRVRVGMHSGLSSTEITFNRPSSRVTVCGMALRLAKAVSDTAHGGMVVLSDTTAALLLGDPDTATQLGGEGGKLWHLGRVAVADDLRHVELFQLLSPFLSPRQALLPPPRIKSQLLPGIATAPAGCVALVRLHVAGLTGLRATDPELATEVYQVLESLLLESLPRLGGYLSEARGGGGEGVVVAFSDPLAAVVWALGMQEEMLRWDWSPELLSHAAFETIALDSPGSSMHSVTAFAAHSNTALQTSPRSGPEGATTSSGAPPVRTLSPPPTLWPTNTPGGTTATTAIATTTAAGTSAIPPSPFTTHVTTTDLQRSSSNKDYGGRTSNRNNNGNNEGNESGPAVRSGMHTTSFLRRWGRGGTGNVVKPVAASGGGWGHFSARYGLGHANRRNMLEGEVGCPSLLSPLLPPPLALYGSRVGGGGSTGMGMVMPVQHLPGLPEGGAGGGDGDGDGDSDGEDGGEAVAEPAMRSGALQGLMHRVRRSLMGSGTTASRPQQQDREEREERRSGGARMGVVSGEVISGGEGSRSSAVRGAAVLAAAWAVGEGNEEPMQSYDNGTRRSREGFAASGQRASAASAVEISPMGPSVAASTARASRPYTGSNQLISRAARHVLFRGPRTKAAVDFGIVGTEICRTTGRLLYRGRHAKQLIKFTEGAQRGQVLCTAAVYLAAAPAAPRYGVSMTPLTLPVGGRRGIAGGAGAGAGGGAGGVGGLGSSFVPTPSNPQAAAAKVAGKSSGAGLECGDSSIGTIGTGAGAGGGGGGIAGSGGGDGGGGKRALTALYLCSLVPLWGRTSLEV